MVGHEEVIEDGYRATGNKPVICAGNQRRTPLSYPGDIAVGVAGDTPPVLMHKSMVVET